MIFKGSRYANVPVYTVTDARGRTVRALGIRFIPATPAGYLHTVTADDRLDLLANTFYRNPEKFWLIADANTAMDPDDLLQPGQQLRIPPDRTS
jgi:nucleoid-associated protein YgaU